jgi:hypothetical protein
MSSPVGWVLPAIAGVATGVAVLAGTNLAIALPAAAVAVISAALLFAELGADRAGAGPASEARSGTDIDRLRLAFQSGRIGREEIVLALVRLERRSVDPGLRMPSAEELRRIVDLPRDGFLGYVRSTVDRLEQPQ